MLKIGIIGCGHIAATHMNAYHQLPTVEVVACCDNDDQKGMVFAKEYNLTFYKEYSDLLADSEVQVVSICTPHYLHAEMTIAALAAEKHVLCEKPMALTALEVDAIEAEVTKSQKKYGVCFQNRFNDSALYLKQLIEAHSFGALKGIKCSVTWHRDVAYYLEAAWRGKWATEGGGVLMNQAIHTLDLITWLIGTPYKLKGKVMTTVLKDIIEVEDTAMATALLANEVPVSIFATNSYSADPTPEIIFDFEAALVELTMDQLLINGEVSCSSNESEATQENHGKAYWGNGHLKMITAFIGQIQDQPSKVTSYVASLDAANLLKIVTGIYQSDKTNDWVIL